MSPTTLLILGSILGAAENVVPIFIHNPQSQQVEAVITTTVNNLFATLAQIIMAQQQGKTQPK